MGLRNRSWNALALKASEPNPFFEPWYLLPSVQNLPDTGNVEILACEIGGELAGLMPIVRSRRYYRWPMPNLASWVHENCFCGTPLVRKGAEASFWKAILRWADDAAGKAMFLHLRNMVLDGPVYAALRDVATQEGRQIELVHRQERALLSSTSTPDAYLETALSGKKRKELRRQASRLAEIGKLHFERRNDAAHVHAWSDDFLELEQRGWKGNAGSALASNRATARLFTESLAGAAAAGRLERLALLLDERPIAMLATFLTPPGAFSYKTAFDEDFARFSPGVLLQRENLNMLAHPNIEWTDSCADADHPMIDHIWRERRAIGRVSVAIGGKLRRAAFHRFVKAEISRNPPGHSA